MSCLNSQMDEKQPKNKENNESYTFIIEISIKSVIIFDYNNNSSTVVYAWGILFKISLF